MKKRTSIISLGIRTDYSELLSAFYINYAKIEPRAAWETFLRSSGVDPTSVASGNPIGEELDSWAPTTLHFWGNQMTALCMLAAEIQLPVALEIVDPTYVEEGKFRVCFLEKGIEDSLSKKRIFLATFYGSFFSWSINGYDGDGVYCSLSCPLSLSSSFNEDFALVKKFLPDIKTAL
ncbi:MAG: hypothetical protein HGB03_01895 [Candidatus Yonathbacteria bacterium]|nr:hypothetical protein [Candidatus Yonathbacteria bacterium]NTW48011.1 hypothetical protein [Candidatus Yonathbacteria bacterium]